jgi:co-chaperonin GroES (HSP10)
MKKRINMTLSVKPFKNHVIIKLPEVQEITSSGIHLPKKRHVREQAGEIIAVSDHETEFQVGQYVAFTNGEFKKIDIKYHSYSEEIAFVHTKFIIGIFEND